MNDMKTKECVIHHLLSLLMHLSSIFLLIISPPPPINFELFNIPITSRTSNVYLSSQAGEAEDEEEEGVGGEGREEDAERA